MEPSRASHSRLPSLAVERKLAREGFRLIAGVDEAGRGSWAGPLVAGAVILGEVFTRTPAWCAGINDSKLLTAGQRDLLSSTIWKRARAVGVGIVSPAMLDLIGLTAAGQLAMRRALRSLGETPEYVLVDAFRIPDLPMPQQPIIHGDQLSLSIAAGSIIAKTVRDRMMCALSEAYPHYGFELHKGYGTRLHRSSLAEVGASIIHRHSYMPVMPFVLS